MPDGHRRFVFRLRPGIHFADDPVFQGWRGESMAADHVCSVERCCRCDQGASATRDPLNVLEPQRRGLRRIGQAMLPEPVDPTLAPG